MGVWGPNRDYLWGLLCLLHGGVFGGDLATGPVEDGAGGLSSLCTPNWGLGGV